MDFAVELTQNPRSGSNIFNPTVIGAVIDLGHCLDLLDFESLILVREAYDTLLASYYKSGFPIPVNKCPKGSNDLLLRDLDCAVLQAVHLVNKKKANSIEFDSVRGVFFEGEDLYKNSGFREKDHIQICIRNPNCIKGYFRPKETDHRFARV